MKRRALLKAAAVTLIVGGLPRPALPQSGARRMKIGIVGSPGRRGKPRRSAK